MRGSILALSFSLLTPPLTKGGFFKYRYNLNEALKYGDIGEHLCVVSLLKMGYDCKIINLGTIDIVVPYNDKLIRVQVKGSNLHTRSDQKNPTPFYFFSTAIGGKKEPITTQHCDVLALVALDIQSIVFKIPCGQASTRLKRKHYINNVEILTWEDCLNHIL